MSASPTQINAVCNELIAEAEAIMKVQQATADGLRFLKEAGADNAVLTLRSLEAFEKAANGKATKIIIPSEIHLDELEHVQELAIALSELLAGGEEEGGESSE